jgi:hypothetical protein
LHPLNNKKIKSNHPKPIIQSLEKFNRHCKKTTTKTILNACQKNFPLYNRRGFFLAYALELVSEMAH